MQGLHKEVFVGILSALVFYVVQKSLNLLVELRLVRGVLIPYTVLVAKHALLLRLHFSWGIVEN